MRSMTRKAFKTNLTRLFLPKIIQIIIWIYPNTNLTLVINETAFLVNQS